MGTCYYLVDPIGQNILDVDKARWIFNAEPDLGYHPISVETLRSASWGCDDLYGLECDCDNVVLHSSRKNWILKWMEDVCEGRPFYYWADTSPQMFPPIHGPEEMAWGREDRIEGWTYGEPEGARKWK